MCTFQLGYLKLSSAAFVFTHVNRNMHAHTNTHTQTYIQGGCLEDQCGYWLGCCLSSWCRVRGEPCLSLNPNILLNPNIFLAHSFVCKSEVCVCVCVCVCVHVHVHVHSVTRTLLLCWGLKVDLTIRASCSNAFAPTSGVFVLQFASKSMPY